MPLEATMMIIDNSEYMRNGDYQPTRFDAQADAVNAVFQTKIDSNPENTVGIMSMAGKGPEVLVTHTKDLGHILQAIHTTSSKIGGAIDIPTAVAVAQLALKHRENKSLRQRIIVFVGSPLEGPSADEKNMVKLAKKLRKNNVAVDVVCYGDGIEEPGEEGKTVLKAFVENVSNNENSHIAVIPPGAHLLSDLLISSPVLAGDRSASIPAEFGGEAPASTSAAANDFEFGVDPSLDPELAMVCHRPSWHRMSMTIVNRRCACLCKKHKHERLQRRRLHQPIPLPQQLRQGQKEVMHQRLQQYRQIQQKTKRNVCYNKLLHYQKDEMTTLIWMLPDTAMRIWTRTKTKMRPSRGRSR
ncbi:hypothetical protein BDN72DRAFT_774243 [Pluteus cervinus]|uniref:Uncharacterized protein n=1 Tax=Pluteus cervinus TaxID=181527 RepID=A0ACD3AGR5_9AGAR|nr:hypothetical protein BDN72DRAFT_774243 [Pluteus cervinus]